MILANLNKPNRSSPLYTSSKNVRLYCVSNNYSIILCITRIATFIYIANFVWLCAVRGECIYSVILLLSSPRSLSLIACLRSIALSDRAFYTRLLYIVLTLTRISTSTSISYLLYKYI